MPDKAKKAGADKATVPETQPPLGQVAALCLRGKGKDREVLLITSRGTGRWIIPKGWPIKGKSGPEAALQEAWEEAGVKSAKVSKKPVGSFAYDKLMDDGSTVPIIAQIYEVQVEELRDSFPESEERRRRWVTPGKAAKLVDEKQLKALLKSL